MHSFLKINKKEKIIAAILIILILICIGVSIFVVYKAFSNEKNTNDNIIENDNNYDNEIDELEQIKIKNITADKVEFESTINLKVNEKIKLYLYPEAKYIGQFKIKQENNTKYFSGLYNALKQLNLENDNYKIIIIKENGKSLGYFNLYINNKQISEKQESNNKDGTANNENSQNKVKTITVNEEIPYTTKEINEINLPKGKKQISQNGRNGLKTVNYEVTYNSNNEEISRKKTSEKTILNPIEQITKVGISDYNINSDTYSRITGMICNEEQLIKYDYLMCDPTKGPFQQFFAIELKGNYYATCIGNENCNELDAMNLNNILPITKHSQFLFTTTYNNNKIFLDKKSETTQIDLSTEVCNKFKLACGSW